MYRWSYLIPLSLSLGCFEDPTVLDDASGGSSSTSEGESSTSVTDGGSAQTVAEEAGSGPLEDAEAELDDGDGDESTTECVGPQCSVCEAAPTERCDDATEDPGGAIEVGCIAGWSGESIGYENARSVRDGFGTGGIWAPRQGSVFAVLGTGRVDELDSETPATDSDLGPTYCSDDLGSDFDHGDSLPEPLVASDVEGDCVDNPGLVGQGDCSNTIEGQFSQGGSAEDFAALALSGDTGSATSIAFSFAFFSTEYPGYFGAQYNDMFVGWLESERWTGNVSFDETGNPVSLNAGFLDYKDDSGTTVPEFEGTCMRRHAGTRWLASTAPVAPHETAELVLAIFDVSDSIVDSYVFLDGFALGCEAVDRPSTTSN